MFASTGADPKEIMSGGGWKSVAMVMRYSHTPKSAMHDSLRSSLLTRMAEVVPIAPSDCDAQVARTTTLKQRVRWLSHRP